MPLTVSMCCGPRSYWIDTWSPTPRLSLSACDLSSRMAPGRRVIEPAFGARSTVTLIARSESAVTTGDLPGQRGADPTDDDRDRQRRQRGYAEENPHRPEGEEEKPAAQAEEQPDTTDDEEHGADDDRSSTRGVGQGGVPDRGHGG